MPRVSKGKETSMEESINYINMATEENNNSSNNSIIVNENVPQKIITIPTENNENVGGITDEYSEYIKLPVSGYEAHVRGLKIKEEDMLRSNSSTPKNMYDALHEVLFKCTRFITNEDSQYASPFKNVDDLKRKMCMADRDALVWALISQTYGNEHNVWVTCPNCGKGFEAEFNISNSMTVTPYTGAEPYLDKVNILEIPELKWKLYLKLPRLVDEERSLKQNENNRKLANASVYSFVDKLEVMMDAVLDNGMKTKNNIAVYNTPIEIYSVICEKPVKYKDKIFNYYFKEFPYYGTDVNLEAKCPSCDNELKQNMSACPHMFRMVERLY